ncbi:glycosyltransferase [Streptomyces sp. NPDC059850]|uniref:glycosyltransferase n=1 Tax=Streptomyces sp. NPDC059850 TaxID=3346970 RepID=UPI003662AC77
MRITVVTFGTTGDVAPLTGVGVRLAEDGHTVTIATHEQHRALVEGCGLGFRVLPDLPVSAQADDSTLGSARVYAQRMRAHAPVLLETAMESARDADLLLASHMMPVAYHVAECLGIPSMGLHLNAVEPTGEFQVMFARGRSLGPLVNRTLTRTVRALLLRPVLGAVNDLRRSHRLPELRTPAAIHREQAARRWPVLHGFSPTVLPRPAHWRDELEVVGYWWPAEPGMWQPRQELRDFLDAGPPPVFLDFGPAEVGSVDVDLRAVLDAAVRRNGLRAVVQAGWSDASFRDDEVYSVTQVSHSWLLPRTRAAVHHAGAGTTAAALRAGVPSMAVPSMLDQFFWARRAARLGVGPGHLPLQDLNPGQLADRVRRLTTEEHYAGRAREVARRIAGEDGAGAVVARVKELQR